MANDQYRERTVKHMLRGNNHPTKRPEVRAKLSSLSKGRKLSQESKNKMSVSRKNFLKLHPEKHVSKQPGIGKKISDALSGRKKSIEHRQKISKIKKEFFVSHPEIKEKISQHAKERMRNPKYLKKFMQAMHLKPNKQEQKLDALLQYWYPNEWKFVGDGQVIIGNKCPDFMNVNGKKQVIEFFGQRWHSPLYTFKKSVTYHQTYEGTIEHYKKYGFDCLIIWDYELKDENKINLRINKFLNEGTKENDQRGLTHTTD